MRAGYFLGAPGAIDALASKAAPGDVILFKGDGTKPNKAIRRYQDVYYQADAAAYVHAALSLGGPEIMHAVARRGSTTNGVKSDNLHSYATNGTICLLRWPGLTPALAAKLVTEAKALDGTSYDFSGVAAAVWATLVRKIGLKQNPTDRWNSFASDSAHYPKLHCSAFVRRVFISALGPIINPLVQGLTPAPLYTSADIFMSKALVDVPLP